MKQRVISAAIGILLLIGILSLYNTPVLPIALALICGIATYEILIPTHFLHEKSVGIFSSLVSGFVVLLIRYNEKLYPVILAAYMLILILGVLRFHTKFSFKQLCVCAFAVTAIPLGFSSILKMDGMIYTILTCVAAWVTDIGAFFVGRNWGKRKLAPQISPNKTVEGAIGGLLLTGIIFPLVCYCNYRFAQSTLTFSLLHAIIAGLLCALMGMLGDLFASIIKREAGIKDFGKIMPGHGGVMDRFDSFFFVAPTLLYLTQLLPIFT